MSNQQSGDPFPRSLAIAFLFGVVCAAIAVGVVIKYL